MHTLTEFIAGEYSSYRTRMAAIDRLTARAESIIERDGYEAEIVSNLRFLDTGIMVTVSWSVVVGKATEGSWTWSDRWRSWRNKFSAMGYLQGATHPADIDAMRDAARDEAS